jgi:hypothetical protein
MRKTIVLLLGLCGAGCAATVGTTGSVYVPKDAAATCSTHCNEIGLTLNSVVIMADNVGCVCSAAPPPTANGATAGGMAALMMAEEQRRQSSNQQQMQQSQHH